MVPIQTILTSLQAVRQAGVMHIRELEPIEAILSAYRDVALMADRLFPPIALTAALDAALAAKPDLRRRQVRAACAELAVIADTAEDAELRTWYGLVKRALERDFVG